MVPNSRTGEVLLYDWNFYLNKRVQATGKHFPVKWVQDAIETSFGTHLVADCNAFKLRELDEEGRMKTYKTRLPNRIFQFEPVPDSFTLGKG